MAAQPEVVMVRLWEKESAARDFNTKVTLR
jgi:hypothetical protein